MVVVVYEAFLCHVLCQLASRHWGSFKTGIYAGLVQCQWIKGSEHSNIWKDWHVVFTVAVTVRTDILHKGNMEARAVITDSLRVLCHLAV